jgi:hypothetical protein
VKSSRFGVRVLLLAVLSPCGPAWADEPPPAPSVSAIKDCIRQMDIANKWTFIWKLVQIGTPRHPRNSYEALYAPPSAGRDSAFGYPVHVTYSVNGLKDIDAVYWLIRDPRGHWQIPAVCTIP